MFPSGNISLDLLGWGANVPDREYFTLTEGNRCTIFPLGNIAMTTPSDLAADIRALRRDNGLTQAGLAAAAGVGLRFLIELEAGKPTLQLGKVMAVLDALGCDLRLEQRRGLSPWTPAS
jgi:y4mF family transcriptional regulator